jgi:hypothetical protein
MIAYLLNLVDLAFTLHALRHWAVELNPLMQDIPTMMIYKVFVVGALCYWLNKRQERVARIGLNVLAAAFAAVDVWHIVNIAPSLWAVLFR